MGKRRNSAKDPWEASRRATLLALSRRPKTTAPLSAPPKDDAETSRTLAEINKEYFAKELALTAVNGPHSIPAEPHYQKSFFLPAKKDGA